MRMVVIFKSGEKIPSAQYLHGPGSGTVEFREAGKTPVEYS